MTGNGVQRRERENSTWRRARDRKTLMWLNRRNLRERMDETLPSQDNQSSYMEVNQEMRTRRNALGSSNPRSDWKPGSHFYLSSTYAAISESPLLSMASSCPERPKQCGRWPIVHGDSEGKIGTGCDGSSPEKASDISLRASGQSENLYFSIRVEPSTQGAESPTNSTHNNLWHCRVAHHHEFRQSVWDMVRFYDPHLMIITGTRACIGDVRNIVDNLPFDGCMDTRTIGYQDGIWLLWKSNMVTVEEPCSTEQETHALVKVRASSISWLLSAVHASPRLAERKLSRFYWSMKEYQEILDQEADLGIMKSRVEWLVEDKLEWSFIKKKNLELFDFPCNWRNLILDCISSSTLLVLNGEQLPMVEPSRVIRQGDLLSPYLFIKCMEFLSLQTHKACEEKRWKPIRASRSDPKISGQGKNTGHM
ncbi:hypothetical protein PVK06_013236 [Gossypium arboreum]|uniref:Uncharacterized protein n=1 Tax=Gossypium arboreum TaxID=29729 RepID=A0ABR0QEE6_GOSAR|nr:hypothetical protein PVK06_013236 [Gossypium arboreum]